MILFLCVSIHGSAQIEEVRRITETLCSPEFHGRGYYQKGDSIAAEFLKEEFEKLGVKPLPKNDYLQLFPIEGVNRFVGEMAVNHNGRSLKPGVHFMVDPSSAGSKETLKPFVIHGKDIQSEEGIRKQMQKFQRSFGFNAVLFNLAGLTGDSLKNVRGISTAFAEQLPVIEVMDRKFTWSVGRKQTKHPVVYVQDSIVDLTQPFELSIDAEFVEEYQSQNVVAYIPAAKKCAKTIVFTAHYDHLGRMGHETYFPGANDNASGTAMLFTMARYFKENPSEYNVLFVAFAGEEAGLVGSKYFVEHPMIRLKKIAFLVNLDIMGSGEEGITVVNATLFEEQFKLLQEISEKDQLLAKVKKRGPAANSDHYWFTKKGVPAFFIYTMGPNKHYHDVFDKYEELSFVEYDDITTLLIRFVEQLSVK